jgi:UTP:GlnB (protein PII) uridylyltransferase
MKEAEVNSATTTTRLLDTPPIPQTRSGAKRAREELDTLLTEQLGKYASEDTSLVVFGSLARGEWTGGSDLDWTYLIDGQANSDHLRIAQKNRQSCARPQHGPGGDWNIRQSRL